MSARSGLRLRLSAFQLLRLFGNVQGASEWVLVVAPAAWGYVLCGLHVHGGPRVEVVYEVNEQSLQRLGALGRSVLRLALVRDQDVREPQTQFLGKPRQGGDVRCHKTLSKHDVA